MYSAGKCVHGRKYFPLICTRTALHDKRNFITEFVLHKPITTKAAGITLYKKSLTVAGRDSAGGCGTWAEAENPRAMMLATAPRSLGGPMGRGAAPLLVAALVLKSALVPLASLMRDGRTWGIVGGCGTRLLGVVPSLACDRNLYF